MSEIATRNPQAELIGGLRSENFKEQISFALPEGITADRFIRIAVTAVQQNADLAEQKVDRDSVIRSFIQCAQIGLFPDGKEAAIVLFGNKATLLPMVGGYRKIAAEHGWSLRSEVVYEHDNFEFTEWPPTLFHSRALPGTERGPIIAAYAVARHRDGVRIEQKVMYREDILKRKDAARSKAVWDKWEAEMFAKTPARDLFNELPLDPNDKERIDRITQAENFQPGEAVEMLYGPDGQKMIATETFNDRARALEQRIHAEWAAEAVSPQPERTDGDENQGVGGDTGGSADALSSVDPEARLLADVAGEFVPPTGTFSANGPKGPQTLAQMVQHAEGRKILAAVLKRMTEPEDYVDAVWTFCGVYALEIVAAAGREKP